MQNTLYLYTINHHHSITESTHAKADDKELYKEPSSLWMHQALNYLIIQIFCG